MNEEVSKSTLTNSDLAKELREILENTSEGPWAYRPEEFDDWGVVRGAEMDVEWSPEKVRPMIARATHSDKQGEDFLNECRENGNDPWGGDAKFIVWMRNNSERILQILDQENNDQIADEDHDSLADKSAKVVSRLRNYKPHCTNDGEWFGPPFCAEAADLIERLNEENAKLRNKEKKK